MPNASSLDFVAQVLKGWEKSSGWELKPEWLRIDYDRGHLNQKTLCIGIYFVHFSCLLFFGKPMTKDVVLVIKRTSN